MSETITEPEGGFKQTAKDLFAGASGGIAQVLIGQPFDIVKVRLQTTTEYTSALDCATKIWKHEGPGAFYKGTLTPLIGIGACVSVQFGGFHAARRFFQSRNAKISSSDSFSAPSSPTAPLSYPQYYASGAIAGLSNAYLSGPIEHIRIRLQTQPSSPRLYDGPLACIRTLTRHGGLPALYRGQAITLVREAQAYGSWFLTYEYLMNRDVAARGLKGREDVEAWRLAFYGGLAGEMLWLSSYPMDVVKSKMQTDGLGQARNASLTQSVKNATAEAGSVGAKVEAGAASLAAESHLTAQKYKNTMECIAQTFRKEGASGFWRGIGPTLLRAMPVSAATFVVAEMTLRAIT